MLYKVNSFENDYFLILTLSNKSLVAGAFILFTKLWTREWGLPPGPPTIPVLGNALQLPKCFPNVKSV
jgi:hypothetical protein